MKDRLGNEIPPEAVPFARWLEEHGWHYMRKYIPAGEYEEDGQIVRYDGFWEQTIWHEMPTAWPLEEGGIWFYRMTVSDTPIGYELAWPVLLRLAEESSEHDRISCRVPFMYGGWNDDEERGADLAEIPASAPHEPATEQEES